ncbi:MAG: hypothetical protein KDK76_00890 [Chlamydiia bacterium]|nr:hypothetical protein [Chlamydiia bacterium]
MSEVKILLGGYQFTYPQECQTAPVALEEATKSQNSGARAAGNLFLATCYETLNGIYYVSTTIFGTLKRLPTEGKVEARKYLIEEGTKAYTTLLFAATTAFLSIAALFKTEWALSFLEVTQCPPPPEAGGLPPPPQPRRAEGEPYVPDLDEEIKAYLATPEGQLATLNNVFTNQIQDDPYTQELLEDNKTILQAIEDPTDQLPIMKTLLVRIVYMNDWERKEELKSAVYVIQEELAAAKINPEYQEEKTLRVEAARLKIEEDREIRALQERENAEALLRDREAEERRVREAAAKEAEQREIAEITQRYGGILQGATAAMQEAEQAINARFDAIGQDVVGHSKGHFETLKLMVMSPHEAQRIKNDEIQSRINQRLNKAPIPLKGFNFDIPEKKVIPRNAHDGCWEVTEALKVFNAFESEDKIDANTFENARLELGFRVEGEAAQAALAEKVKAKKYLSCEGFVLGYQELTAREKALGEKVDQLTYAIRWAHILQLKENNPDDKEACGAAIREFLQGLDNDS